MMAIHIHKRLTRPLASISLDGAPMFCFILYAAVLSHPFRLTTGPWTPVSPWNEAHVHEISRLTRIHTFSVGFNADADGQRFYERSCVTSPHLWLLPGFLVKNTKNAQCQGEGFLIVSIISHKYCVCSSEERHGWRLNSIYSNQYCGLIEL